MTTDLLEWTPADSKALDAYARSIPAGHHSNETHTSPNSSQHSPGAGGRIGNRHRTTLPRMRNPRWHPEPDASKATPHTAHEGRCRPCHDRARHRIGGHRD